MMTVALILSMVLCVTVPIAILGGTRAFGWTITAFGMLGLIHAAVIIVAHMNGTPLDYRLAKSLQVFATAPLSIVFLATGALTLGVHRRRERRRGIGLE